MNRLVHTRPVVYTVLAGALVLGAAACGGSSSGGSNGGTSGGTSVDVTLKNYSITVAGGSKLAPGTYTFNVTNKGPSSHNLTVNGPGVSDQATPTFAPGTQKLTVKLQKGSYELFCSVPGHKQLGMDTHITVS